MKTACRQLIHKAVHANAYSYGYIGCAYTRCSGISACFDELKPNYSERGGSMCARVCEREDEKSKEGLRKAFKGKINKMPHSCCHILFA